MTAEEPLNLRGSIVGSTTTVILDVKKIVYNEYE